MIEEEEYPSPLAIRLHPELALIAVLDRQLELTKRALMAADYEHQPAAGLVDLVVFHADAQRKAIARLLDAIAVDDLRDDDPF